MKNKSVKTLFLLALVLNIASCNRVKTTPMVKESYADGKPKVLVEYAEDEYGKKTLYKETHYFPGEKKYIEGKYNKEEARNGVWTSWHENGNKNSEGKYIDGQLDGKYRVWYENGKLRYKGQYKMGIRVDVWEFYDVEGNKTKREVYDSKGVKIKEEKF
ncbi:MAG: hypothetical protein FWH36_07535 [Lentimicrobiaceae bacterium]|nr:hypothetical protein [Lentimicrobiaceae bacterium]